jgi:hypothetical protein
MCMRPRRGRARPAPPRRAPARPTRPRRQSLRNPKFTQALLDTVKEAGVVEGCPKAKGNLIYTVASKVRGGEGGRRHRGGGCWQQGRHRGFGSAGSRGLQRLL